MRLAIAEASLARGSTGDNPWVGCVIVDGDGAVVARGHTQGPGEDHAEIVALDLARAGGIDLARATVYSTLEPCAFHGRTPACALALVRAGVPRVITGIRDPNPRVDGAGVAILRAAGIAVIEDICADEITRQLAPWIFVHHPHEPERRARGWLAASHDELVRKLRDHYGIDADSAERVALKVTRG